MQQNDRSRIVAKQPRDSRGRWTAAKSRRTVYVDESHLPKKENFVMSAAVTDKPEEFKRIAERYPANTKHSKSPGELKFATSVDGIRLSVLSDIRDLDPDIYAVIIEKDDAVRPQRVIFKEAARQVIADAVSGQAHEYSVIMDHHEEFAEGRGEEICRKVSSETGREITECRVVSSRESKELQANDFIAGAIGAKCNDGDGSFFDIIKDKVSIRRLLKK